MSERPDGDARYIDQEHELVGGVRMFAGVAAAVAWIWLGSEALEVFREKAAKEWLAWFVLLGGPTGYFVLALQCVLDPRLKRPAALWPRTWPGGVAFSAGVTGVGTTAAYLASGWEFYLPIAMFMAGVFLTCASAAQLMLGRLRVWRDIANAD